MKSTKLKLILTIFNLFLCFSYSDAIGQNHSIGTPQGKKFTDAPLCRRVMDCNYLVKVITQPHLRKECSLFVDNILRQIPSKKLWNYIDDQSKKYPEILTADACIYSHLQNNIDEITPLFSNLNKINALRFQKGVISDQIKTLIGEHKTIHGLLEIGGPGTYTSAIQSFMTINGPIYAMDESTNIADRVKAFSPLKPLNGFLPYDRFIPLSNYTPINESDIVTGSLDLALCTIGLHHIIPERLDAFVASVARTLRCGGHFILRDHNIINEDIMCLTHAAHSLFNLIMTETNASSDNLEYRNFQPIEYWIELLEKHGFKLCTTPQLLQDGDPTLNTMLMFERIARTEDEKTTQISYELKQDTALGRDEIQTNLTTVEWFDVDASQDYGQFINHTPFYEYPWFSTAKTYISLFKKSWLAAAEKKGHWAVLTSEYTPMNCFITASKVIECVSKGIVSYPIYKMFSGEEPGHIALLIKDHADSFKTLHPHIKVSEKQFSISDVKLVQAPRYKELFAILMQAKEHSEKYTILSIAGNPEVQIKICVNDNTPLNADSLEGCKILYDWKMPSHPNQTYFALNVQVNKLLTVLKRLSESNIQIIYVHDF